MTPERDLGIRCVVSELAIDRVIEILSEIDRDVAGRYPSWRGARLLRCSTEEGVLIQLILTPRGSEDRRVTFELEKRIGSSRLTVHDSPIYLVATRGEAIEATLEIQRVFQALSDLPSIS